MKSVSGGEDRHLASAGTSLIGLSTQVKLIIYCSCGWRHAEMKSSGQPAVTSPSSLVYSTGGWDYWACLQSPSQNSSTRFTQGSCVYIAQRGQAQKGAKHGMKLSHSLKISTILFCIVLGFNVFGIFVVVVYFYLLLGPYGPLSSGYKLCTNYEDLFKFCFYRF